jgi:hypothetical protein
VVAPAARPRGIRVRTAHLTEAEFIAAFHELCDETTIFAPTEKMKPVGADCAFSLELADGSPMVRGLGRIRNAWPTDDSPFGRAGIHIEMDQLTDTSKPIHAKLIAAHRAASKTRTRPNPSTHQLWGAPSGPPTEEMNAPDELDDNSITELPTKITREIRGVTLAEIGDDSETKEAKRYPDPPATPKPVGREGTVPVAVVPAPVAVPRPAIAPVVTVPPPVGSAQSSAVESTFDLDSAVAASRSRAWWMNARVGGVFAAGLALGLLISLAFRSGETKQVVVAAASPPPPAATQVAAAQPPPNCPPPPEPTALAVADQAPAKASKQVATKPAEAPATKPTRVAVATTTPKAKPTATKSPAAKGARVAAKRKAAKVPCSSLDCI